MRKTHRGEINILLLWWLLLLPVVPVRAQQRYVNISQFTTYEGLPSNHTYNMTEDNRGFLWIGTDNGVARFDGKYFQKFSTRDGLPSNEVLQVMKDKSGTIWVNCYMEPPAYFDEALNRFSVIRYPPDVENLVRNYAAFRQDKSGAIMAVSRFGNLLLHDKKLIAIGKEAESAINENGKKYFYSIYSWKNNAVVKLNTGGPVIDSLIVPFSGPFYTDLTDYEDRIYLQNDRQVIRIEWISVQPIKVQYKVIEPESGVNSLFFLKDYVAVHDKNNQLVLYDHRNLQYQTSIAAPGMVTGVYFDRTGHLWVNTLDKGVFCYSRDATATVLLPPGLSSANFLSVAVTADHSLMAGNYEGELLIKKGNDISVKKMSKGQSRFWIRKIVNTAKTTTLVTDRYTIFNFKDYHLNVDLNHNSAAVKSCLAINDSVLLMGAINGAYLFNIVTKKQTWFKGLSERILQLARADSSTIYLLGGNGLYRLEFFTGGYRLLKLNITARGEKPQAIACNRQGRVFVCTNQGRLLSLKGNLVQTVIQDYNLSGNVQCMQALDNKILLGSRDGLEIISVIREGNRLKGVSKTVTKSDGLPSNVVNDIAIQNDTVYTATENGVAYFPIHLDVHSSNISPVLVAMRINDKNRGIANRYDLKSSEKNISMTFSGVDVTGHFKRFVYAVNDSTQWKEMLGNTLNIQLNNGRSAVWVRAVDSNERLSGQILRTSFNVATPFYQSTWFLTMMLLLISGGGFAVYNRRKFAFQQRVYNERLALEKQRMKITADLHDDIGASLSSLQVNSAIAQELISRNPAEAKKVLDKIESQSRNLSEKIGDFIWSMKPGKDEFMTMTSRIITYVNEILGSTTIHYDMDLDKELDKLIIDFTVRKNLVMIAKEAVNNAAKYSNASRISVVLKRNGHQVLLEVKDDGTGFNTSETKGNGLDNMRRRAEEIKGSCNIISAPGSATTIQVLFPLIP